jgi:hypothetical protein
MNVCSAFTRALPRVPSSIGKADEFTSAHLSWELCSSGGYPPAAESTRHWRRKRKLEAARVAAAALRRTEGPGPAPGMGRGIREGKRGRQGEQYTLPVESVPQEENPYWVQLTE